MGEIAAAYVIAVVASGKTAGKGAWREAGGGWEVRIGRGLCGQVLLV